MKNKSLKQPMMAKSDFLVKSKEELHFVDRRFHIPARARSISETIEKTNGEWIEGGQTMTILEKLLEIEEFLWENRHKSDEIIEPKVWEAIVLSRQISALPAEKTRGGKKALAISVTVGYTGLVDCWVLKTSQRNLSQDRKKSLGSKQVCRGSYNSRCGGEAISS